MVLVSNIYVCVCECECTVFVDLIYWELQGNIEDDAVAHAVQQQQPDYAAK